MCLALLAFALGATPAAPPGLAGVAEALAAEIGPPPEGRRGLALAVEGVAPALAPPLESALAAALSRRGYAVSPLRGAADPEPRAREAGADWVVRVRGGLAPGRTEIALVGELIPTWSSFFLQRRPGVRPVPPRLVQARAAADPETLLLARPGRAADASRVAIRVLARVPGRVLALAVGDPVGDGAASAILAVTAGEAILLSGGGARLASRPLELAGRRPVRDPAATAAIGDFGGGRLALAVAGEPAGRVFAWQGGRLEPAGTIAAAPLCATDGGRIFGAFAPGKGLLADVLSPTIDPEAPPRSGREWLAVAAAPRGGPYPVAALGAGGRLELLRGDLGTAGVLDGVGAGFALADLDGDGTAEVVASTGTPGTPERVRVLEYGAAVAVAFESPPIAGAILAGAAGDVTGDGIDDAVLAAVVAADGGVATDLLLVTADPRVVP